MGAKTANGAVDTSRRGKGRGSVRGICAILSLVHNQMGVSLLQSVSLCLRVSHLPLCLHRSDYTSQLTCRRSLVGTLSCNTMCHIDAISSATEALCSFSTPASIVCPDVVSLSSFLVVRYTTWVPGTREPFDIISLGGMIARKESVARGLSSARFCPLPGLSPCLLLSLSCFSPSALWYSRS